MNIEYDLDLEKIDKRLYCQYQKINDNCLIRVEKLNEVNDKYSKLTYHLCNNCVNDFKDEFNTYHLELRENILSDNDSESLHRINFLEKKQAALNLLEALLIEYGSLSFKQIKDLFKANGQIISEATFYRYLYDNPRFVVKFESKKIIYLDKYFNDKMPLKGANERQRFLNETIEKQQLNRNKKKAERIEAIKEILKKEPNIDVYKIAYRLKQRDLVTPKNTLTVWFQGFDFLVSKKKKVGLGGCRNIYYLKEKD